MSVRVSGEAGFDVRAHVIGDKMIRVKLASGHQSWIQIHELHFLIRINYEIDAAEAKKIKITRQDSCHPLYLLENLR